jgi:hypothetical protein
MRFIAYVPAAIRGAKIDWEVRITLTSEERAALVFATDDDSLFLLQVLNGE